MVELFDKLLVLTADGEMCYFGQVDRSLLREIFLGRSNDDDDSPNGDKGSIADLVLGASLDKTGEAENLIKNRYDASSTAHAYAADIAQLRCQAPKGADVLDLFPEREYPNSFSYRFKLISKRRIKLIQRNAVTWMRMFIAILFAVIIGSLFANSSNDLGGSLAKVRMKLPYRCFYWKLQQVDLKPIVLWLHLTFRMDTSSFIASSFSCCRPP